MGEQKEKINSWHWNLFYSFGDAIRSFQISSGDSCEGWRMLTLGMISCVYMESRLLCRPEGHPDPVRGRRGTHGLVPVTFGQT